MKTEYIPTLDGWRAVAIGMVIAYHASMVPFGTVEAYRSSWAYLLRFGHIGVALFFGISGFLITTLLLREEARNGRISLSKFYIRRCFRILPAYYALLGSITILGLITSRAELMSSLCFVRNYIHEGAGGGSYVTGHLWSLAVEEHFYLLWPGLLA
ncbi:MAG: acyltransferase, partial [Acidobacteriaceae bacterium]|nr:acyltransferase [Acidobacteriaceae bacterium]